MALTFNTATYTIESTTSIIDLPSFHVSCGIGKTQNREQFTRLHIHGRRSTWVAADSFIKLTCSRRGY